MKKQNLRESSSAAASLQQKQFVEQIVTTAKRLFTYMEVNDEDASNHRLERKYRIGTRSVTPEGSLVRTLRSFNFQIVRRRGDRNKQRCKFDNDTAAVGRSVFGGRSTRYIHPVVRFVTLNCANFRNGTLRYVPARLDLKILPT